MHLTIKERNNMLEKRLVVDCPEMTLTQQADSSPRIYRGPGHISQDSEGQLHVKIFCQERFKGSRFLFSTPAPPGQIIPQHEFYELSATDCLNRRWIARQIIPHVTPSVCETGFVVYGSVNHVTWQREAASEGDYAGLSMWFSDAIAVPANRPTISKVNTAGQTSISYALDVALFDSCGFKFTIYREGERTVLQAHAPSVGLPPFMALRVCEALQFVLARNISWCVLEEYSGSSVATHLRGHSKKKGTSRIPPPIADDGPAGCVWELCRKYMQHILGFDKDEWHPLTRLMHALIESGSASLEAEALTLAVSVEGVLKEAFSDLSTGDPKLKKNLKVVEDCMAKAPLDPDFRRRLDGLLSSITAPRAIDRLHRLSRECGIDEALVSAWGKLRNRATHADLLTGEDVGAFLQCCHEVTALFYQLVFLRIGYSGKYTDYSTPGWPVKDFQIRSASKTEE